MRDLTLYETLGIAIPGAVLLAGCAYLFPQIRQLMGDDTLTVGGFGLFLVVAYALGHLVALAGNVQEAGFWRIAGGRPSSWLADHPERLITEEQLHRLEERLRTRHGADACSAAKATTTDWNGRFELIYRDVLTNGDKTRVEAFNGNYGLNRGLAAALFALSGVTAVSGKPLIATVTLGILGVAYLVRMRRFAIHFVRENLLQFILLPELTHPLNK